MPTRCPRLGPQRLAHCRHVMDNEQQHFAMPEQFCPTEYCERPTSKMKLWRTPVGRAQGTTSFMRARWQGKPPNGQMCLPGTCPRRSSCSLFGPGNTSIWSPTPPSGRRARSIAAIWAPRAASGAGIIAVDMTSAAAPRCSRCGGGCWLPCRTSMMLRATALERVPQLGGAATGVLGLA